MYVGITANGSRVPFGNEENGLELDSDGGCTTL